MKTNYKTTSVIEIAEDGSRRTHPISNRADFIQTVDRIRRCRNYGWQLMMDGEISDEESVFGSSVCYGVNEPSYFSDEPPK